MKEIRIIELFSGIGSQHRALKNIGIKPQIIATCEWDIHALLGYFLFHHDCVDYDKIINEPIENTVKYIKSLSLSSDGKKASKIGRILKNEKIVLNAIAHSIKTDHNLVDITKIKSFDEEADILTYSFPCQDLSNVGALHGYNKGIAKNSHSRSSLLWEVGRILKNTCKSKRPKYLIMENVKTLLSKRHFGNFLKWIKELEELGYSINKYIILDARNTGLPQKRQRIIMYSVLDSKSSLKERKYIESLTDELIYNNYKEYLKKESTMREKFVLVQDLIQDNYNNKKLLQEAIECTPNDTPSRRRIQRENPIIDERLDSIPTLTTKQDRNPNSGTISFSKGGKGKSKFRFLTPRECLLFMGFNKNDYDSLTCFNDLCLKSKFFKRDIIYHMAGNSIPVNLLESVFYQIKKIEENKV